MVYDAHARRYCSHGSPCKMGFVSEVTISFFFNSLHLWLSLLEIPVVWRSFILPKKFTILYTNISSLCILMNDFFGYKQNITEWRWFKFFYFYYIYNRIFFILCLRYTLDINWLEKNIRSLRIYNNFIIV